MVRKVVGTAIGITFDVVSLIATRIADFGRHVESLDDDYPAYWPNDDLLDDNEIDPHPEGEFAFDLGPYDGPPDGWIG
jgi:hypothetical protein